MSAVFRVAVPVCLLVAGCAKSGIDSEEDDAQDSSTSPSAAMDGGVRRPDADPNGSSRSDAATSDGGCAGKICLEFDCPDGQVPTVCGCGAPDSDGDGTPDCADQCPADRNKKLPGSCGCGASDADTDLDGAPDCSDKCSGDTDATYVPDASCGIGYCRSHNQASTCVSGIETQCRAGAPLSGTDATCDGVDDDCDGTADEDFGMRSSGCGTGICARAGTVSCVAGKVLDSCVAGAATASSDASCDGIDDDCDGRPDEDFPARASSCAAGACAATGVVSCSGGKVVDSCSASAPVASSDATCNNVDEDCDGSVDEDFKPTATKCGVGACASTGTTSCSRGTVVDSCKPATKPSAVDTSCNNVDDDCNGKVDDGFAASATRCGQGVCAASGTLTCASGVAKDSCVPGQPTNSTDDAFLPGNGLDDDCDGKVDEDVPTCNTTPLTFEAGSHSIAVPGNCRSVSVSLWGGGGAGGQAIGIGLTMAAGGAGGPGGFVSATSLINGAIKLSVGGGGASSCNAGGGNAESSAYNGGSGGGGSGEPGGDGSAPGGGDGGDPTTGERGGSGHFGGGGGGAGNGNILGIGPSCDAGGGGAATVLTINGVRAAVAGGGGGGGGAQGALLGTVGSRGGAGGSGCGADGRVETSTGGGGGGGGLCIGASTQPGSGVTPASSDRLPNGRARGGSSSCDAGGAGYAIVTFKP